MLPQNAFMQSEHALQNTQAVFSLWVVFTGKVCVEQRCRRRGSQRPAPSNTKLVYYEGIAGECVK